MPAMMMRMGVLLAAVLGLACCGGPKALEVRPFHLREVTEESGGEPMIEGEQRRRMYGAIGVREREQRLGEYFTVEWNDDAVGEPVKVLFEYRQGSSGSKVLRKEQSFGSGEVSGKAEFAVIGNEYLEGGRVLAWRCRLLRGEREVASRRSYLWD